MRNSLLRNLSWFRDCQHVGVALELASRKITNGPLESELVGAFGHRQHQVVRVSEPARLLRDGGPAMLPVVAEFFERFFAEKDVALLILEGDLALA
jgi:hypothetical protein